jgi:predicted cupin superfamily sugar epimerase
MLQLQSEGEGRTISLGTDLSAGQVPQVVVPKGVWQGCMLDDGGRYALMGTTMSPGFDASDFEIGERDRLVEEYPKWSDMIRRLTQRS